MQIDDLSVKKIDKILLNENYVPDNEISTTLYLSFLLGKPMLIEGPPGVGKTQLAKVIASAFDRDFFRIQCYEGITFEQIVGEWNYQKIYEFSFVAVDKLMDIEGLDVRPKGQSNFAIFKDGIMFPNGIFIGVDEVDEW